MKTTYNLSKFNQPAVVCLAQKVLRRQNPKISSQISNQAGFSLVESLVAVVVVSVLLTGIAPFLALTFGQRVQARRIDLATQAGRAYIDGVRSGTIPLPNQFNTADFNNQNNLGNTTLLSALPTDAGTQISTDGTPFSTNNPQHLVIWPLRSPCITPVGLPACDNTIAGATALRQQGYRLSVRVYRADAFNSPISAQQPIVAGSSIVQSPSTATLGSRTRPLVVMQSDITANSATGSSGTTFRNYQDRLGN
jgi:prepilin-type N-terminal cleavage/methylation domain-containing protein